MAVAGMRGSGSWSSSERPENFRDKILFLYPNSPAILTAISGRLKTENTDDPHFNIFEKGLPVMRWKIDYTETNTQSGGDLDDCTTIYLDETLGETDPQLNFRAGQVIICERTREVMWVASVGSDANGKKVVVDTRGSHATPSDKAALADGDYLLIIGTANAEGSSVPAAITHDATVVQNYCQIFRTPLHLTGTAKQTYLRTGDPEKELKRMAAERHAIEMEWAWIFGKKNLTTVSGQPKRTTGGILERVTTNVYDALDAVTKPAWESFLEKVFLVPNSRDEKLCLCGNKALTTLNAMASAYGDISLVPTSDSFGLKLSRWETPYGTLYLKGHPLLSQNATFNDWGIVIDTSNVVYRPLRARDTQFLKDRQNPGDDAIICEYLTEAGLELRHESTHGVFKNASAFQP